MADFDRFFLLTGGGGQGDWGQSLRLGGQMPPLMLPLVMAHLQEQTYLF